MSRTYNRKYYLHRRIKSSGFGLQLEHTHKTIEVKPDQVDAAKNNKYVTELQRDYSYGIQVLNPLVKIQ